MGLFSFLKPVPTELEKIIQAIAEELPWKVTADGAAALPFEAAAAKRASKLLDALEPEVRNPLNLHRQLRSRYFCEVDVRGARQLEAETKYGTAKGVTDPVLLEAINKAHGLNAKLPTEPGLGHMGREILRVPAPNTVAKEAAQEGSHHIPSAAELIERGNEKTGRER